MDEDYEKDCYDVDYEEYRGCDYGEDDEYDDGDESADEREEEGSLIIDDLNNPDFGKDERENSTMEHSGDIMNENEERTIRDIYDVIKSMYDYNVRELRYWGQDRCCCCGDSDKEKCFILCKQCASFWDSGNEARKLDGEFRHPLADIYWALNDKVIKFPSLEEFRDKFSDKIQLAIPHIGKRMLGTHGEERGIEIIRLISCLREREKQIVMDVQFIDDLICSVVQRWNIREEIVS